MKALAYHQRTKHGFGGFAASPDTLDWDAQPNPFREFAGAEKIDLDLAPLNCQSSPFSRAGLGALLHLGFGLSAWKSFGPDRWALRCNPSSGNLHPTEAYILSENFSGVADGLHHYLSRDHVLEKRRADPAHAGPARLWIGLSSIHWREAWKYGERAFRYCQLDLGHALGALSYAAQTLGFRAKLVDGVDSAQLARLLGLDRTEDFGAAEREDADALVEIFASAGEPSAPAAKTGVWSGAANMLDAKPMYRWPVIDDVTQATLGGSAGAENFIAQARAPAEKITADLILQRRSAQAFNPKHRMTPQDFFDVLAALAPQNPPFDLWGFAPRIHPLLFVHRVEGLPQGLYALPRSAEGEALLRKNFSGDFVWRKVLGAPDSLPLYLLKEMDARGLARRLFCNQGIGGDSSFGVAMLAEFGPLVEANPWRYRQLHWEAGLIGQALYLEAERVNLRGTGIGCYFDDETHALFGLSGPDLQSLYHFTVGLPYVDARLATEPAYPNKVRPERFA
ncbi:SagB-type dehydrogenase domain-containing protein [Rhodoblastus acidophilus]|uniref:SagB-type dehydrogenase domain-containing protein n=1 Tax=Rhodoblastus acidophilus TaxID=1074 RepID=A0A212R2W3_RHOAC|nr:nitroreductase family protein [Rhodoblastus acidophilus]PPQ40287.1 nitroreductase [Rhodoblastus acidophilus]RAI16755.1 nitroreductase [Rhodoblastus acidophilus]SNB66374.1 SagB-type dehydrogenase domain-containing protein [Rhodoblastus acidophilus]